MKQIIGLSNEEVAELTAQGKTNHLPKPEIKSNSQIIFGHVFTLFNLYNIIIAVALLYVKAYTSLFFVGVLVSNTFMFSVQEIRSKNLISKLSIIVTPRTTVIRNGKKEAIDNESIVLGDYIYLEAGNQISADATVIDGYVEVNESLLTGEIEPIDKQKGASLLSGSYIVSGACIAQVIHVGNDNYAVKITSEIKKNRVISSELLRTFKAVTKLTSFFIIPLGAILVYQGLVVRGQPLTSVIVNSSTALLGMLPQGLVLLTTVSLMASVLRLGSHKTLIQDLYAIETLSQVDVLCLDKTGTLTYGEMKVIEEEVFNPLFGSYMNSFLHFSNDNNATFIALKNAYNGEPMYSFEKSVPFSSLRKWSSISFVGAGSLIIGAPEIIAPNFAMSEHMINLRQKGARLLIACRTDSLIDKETPLSSLSLETLAVIAIQDIIREDANEALAFFKENDVLVKVISGDNPETVRSIAIDAGVDESEGIIDASTLNTDEEYENAIMNYNIIGRASPNQKLRFVEILQRHKLKVAMTGDGINDVLALKQSNCSIAMGEGSDAALNISQVVVMDGNLSTLVDVFKEGRQVINNITLSASMYYLRTIMTIFLSLIAVMLNVPFPFVPFQVTLTNMFVDGFPSFMILFEKNIEKPKESIRDHVLRHSFPNALATIAIWIIVNLIGPVLHVPQSSIETAMFFLTAYISIQLIYRIYKPFNLYRVVVIILDCIGFCIGVFLFWNWLELKHLTQQEIVYTAILTVISTVLIVFFEKIIVKYLKKKQAA